MAINASGTISANSGAAGSNIALEFGWTPPLSLATKTPRSTVPTSGFNLSAFYGKSNASTLVTSPYFICDPTNGVDFEGASSGSMTVRGDGTLTYVGGIINGAINSRWLSGSVGASTFYLRIHVYSRDLSGIVMSNWGTPAVGSNSAWYLWTDATNKTVSASAAINFMKSTVFSIDVSLDGTNVAYSSGRITVTANNI